MITQLDQFKEALRKNNNIYFAKELMDKLSRDCVEEKTVSIPKQRYEELLEKEKKLDQYENAYLGGYNEDNS